MARFAVLCVSLILGGSASAETLRVLALQSEPFFYDDGGRPAGIEYDILRYFAKTRGAELDVEYAASFPDLLARIEKGEADIASGTITITPERVERMDFSAGYFPVQVVLVERKGETSASLSELSGFEVAAFVKTTAEDALRVEPGIEVVQRTGLPGMLDAVASGEIRAAAADSSAVIPALEDYPTLQISLKLGEEQQFGFATPKGSPLSKALSQHLMSLKASGIYFRLVTEHLGPAASSIVRAAKAP